MLKKSKKILSVFVVMLSVVFSATALAGCKKKKSTTDDDTPATPTAVTITAEMISLEYETVVFDGSDKNPTVTVKNGETDVATTEYTVSYSDCKNVGTATVTVAAAATSTAYTGSASKTFEITAAELPAIQPIDSVVDNGAAQVPAVYIEGLVPGTDYETSWEYKSFDAAEFSAYETLTFNAAGTYKVTATGEGNYSGTQTATYVIYKALPAFAAIESTDYDGSVQNPTITLAGVTAGVDYELSYRFKAYGSQTWVAFDGTEFINAGEYEITATGKGNYAGFKKVSYTIRPVSFGSVTIDMSATANYDGDSHIPTYSVEDLVEGEDYVVSWEYKSFIAGSEFAAYDDLTFVNAGEYKATVSGIGNCMGTATASYFIERTELPSLSATKAPYRFNGTKTTPVVTGNESAEYVVKYTKNEADKDNLQATSWVTFDATAEINAGVYYMRVFTEATANRVATVSPVATFEIYKDTMPGLSSIPASVVYDGTSKDPNIVIEKFGKPLTKGLNAYDTTCDYYIEWEYNGAAYVLDADPTKNFIEVGTYYAYLYANEVGNYEIESGARTSVFFSIVKADLADFIARVITPPTYTGEAFGFDIFTFKTTGNAYTISVQDGELVCSLGGTVKIYYSSTSTVMGVGEWNEYTATTVLNGGTQYFIYAEISGLAVYDDEYSMVQNFTVQKATASELSMTATDSEIEYTGSAIGNELFTFAANGYTVSYDTDGYVCSLGGTVTIYYTDSETPKVGGSGWTEYTGTEVLDDATNYYFYVTITGIDNYNDITSTMCYITVGTIVAD